MAIGDWSSDVCSSDLGGLWTQFSETEITSTLILIAIRMRVWLEQVNDSIDTSKLLCGGTNVNCYHAENKIENLDLREACNKIIHAKKIRLQEASLQFIFIYGENRKIPWKTTLDLFQFVEHVCTLTLSRDQFSK